MKLTQSMPATPLLTMDEVLAHLRLDDSMGQDSYLNVLVLSATAHAEQAMQCSLLTREITATFYSGEILYLTRGPVQDVTSVQLNGTLVSESNYSLEHYGHAVLLRYYGDTTQPHAAPATLSVTYTAGYGDGPGDVPADIVAAIRAHIGLLYESREVAGDRTIKAVPFLEDFYKLRSMDVGVG